MELARFFLAVRTALGFWRRNRRAALAAGKTYPEEAEAIFRLTSMPTFKERFVLPPLSRERQIEATENPFSRKQESGFGFRRAPERRF